MRPWEANIRRTDPYVPGEQPKEEGIIKLNTNENPYPPSPGVLRALQTLPEEALRRYPDPACTELRRALAAQHGVGTEQVFVGVGSDDVLAMCFLTFFAGTSPILFPDITYSFYEVWARMLRIPYTCIPLDADFGLRIEDYARENGGIIFPNPNAPTGKLLALSQIERMVAAHPESVVIVDEAYIDFGGTSAIPLIDRYENLLVVQTFSKSKSMAGMRIGAAYGSERLIRALSEIKFSFNSYTMSSAALAAGCAAVADEAYYAQSCAKIIATRERVKPQMQALGFSFADSKANFLFAAHRTCPAKELFEALKAAKIYVRYFDAPRTSNFLRITIGTDEEMDTLLAFLKGYLQKR